MIFSRALFSLPAGKQTNSQLFQERTTSLEESFPLGLCQVGRHTRAGSQGLSFSTFWALLQPQPWGGRRRGGRGGGQPRPRAPGSLFPVTGGCDCSVRAVLPAGSEDVSSLFCLSALHKSPTCMVLVHTSLFQKELRKLLPLFLPLPAQSCCPSYQSPGV